MDSKLLATDIVKKFIASGYIAYFAGGWVRDYLLGTPSDDIDIATNAPPEKILELFPHTILVGLAFGVVIVVLKGHQFEVATFRRDKDYVNGRAPSSIELAEPEEDASRRDFTINGMFYDPIKDEIYDYVHGHADLKSKMIRTIGDPYLRFNEDRLRMIRAVRFAARFEFSIDEETEEAIFSNAGTLFPAVAMERVWQEFVKMSKSPNFDQALINMHRLELLPTIFSQLRGTHLNEIKLRVSHFSQFPPHTETIFYLLELFPDISLEEVNDLGVYLHLSKVDMGLAEFVVKVRKEIEQEKSNVINMISWVNLYSHLFIQKILQITALKLLSEDRTMFVTTHIQRIECLKKHIDRKIQKKPLVNATMLQSHGVLPGKQMGILLKEAEALAITLDINDAERVISLLKNHNVYHDNKIQ